MSFFKHRSPVKQDGQSSVTAQNEPSQQYRDSGTAPQYQEPSRNPQYERTGAAEQYESTGRNPQYQEPGTNQQQYEGTGRGPQYERTGRSNQAVGTPRGATQPPRGLPGGWLGEIALGLATLVIGLIVAFHPTHTLNALAILIGVLMVVSGVYHVIRSLRSAGDHRMWGGIAGVLFFLTGIFLLRHVSLTLAIIALFAGFAFVIAGIAALAEAISGRSPLGRLWSALFGLICLFAGIAAITTPIHTLARLAIVIGWAFVAMGIMHIIGAIVSMRDLRKEWRSEQISVPGQRATESTGVEGAYGASPEAEAGASTGAPKHRRSRL